MEEEEREEVADHFSATSLTNQAFTLISDFQVFIINRKF